MSVVVDCSVTLSWYLDDETEPLSILIEDHVAEHGAVIPFHWHAEMANGLLMAVRRGRIAYGFIRRAFAQFEELTIVIDDESRHAAKDAAISLGQEHRLSVYDALYLETAMRRGLPLATFDKALQRAAQVAGVPIFQSANP
ncbi:PIN domain-containing protein [Oceaniradius stylonematis]|uniref:Ribonuclease VapC n=1 Tax=Oceaniradius stylonematis TaxID=2184161 RepID=A0A3A8AEC6_9HYPH|nr:type II toxin-antitoxin system VapC family toxin [Oceaniradius stylonematis]RKF06020.1 PIN domain-containing protein [Oceaniradius stylonematis]